MNINYEANRLINFAVQNNLIDELDAVYASNLLLEVLNLDEFEEVEVDEKLQTATSILENMLDYAVEKIVNAITKTGASVVGPIPLPTEKQVYTILRAVHKDKDSREQFEIRTHKRIIDIIGPNNDTIEALRKLDLPSGVDIDIKL